MWPLRGLRASHTPLSSHPQAHSPDGFHFLKIIGVSDFLIEESSVASRIRESENAMPPFNQRKELRAWTYYTSPAHISELENTAFSKSWLHSAMSVPLAAAKASRKAMLLIASSGWFFSPEFANNFFCFSLGDRSKWRFEVGLKFPSTFIFWHRYILPNPFVRFVGNRKHHNEHKRPSSAREVHGVHMPVAFLVELLDMRNAKPFPLTPSTYIRRQRHKVTGLQGITLWRPLNAL